MTLTTLTRTHRRSLLVAALAAVGVAGCAATQPCCESEKALAAASAAPVLHAQGDVVPMPPLPDGWTEADMLACVAAGTPGEMHEHLAEAVGTWHGACKMWMAPGTEPMESETTMEVSMMMDGRYARVEYSGEMPGMGTFEGLGFNGYDNTSEKFVACWMDNHSTKLMTGEGELSDDGKTMTWKFSYTCPVTKSLATMREVERTTGPDAKTLEMYMVDPKSGEEYKAMQIDFTRRP